MEIINKKWQARFMSLARQVASWSKDESTKVGAVIVRPDRTIASVGFNGFARGVRDDRGGIINRETKLMRTIHAELNAILSAKEPLGDCFLFVWPFQPCAQCAAAIIQSGIKRVYFPVPTDIERGERWKDSFNEALAMFYEAGIYVAIV